MSDLINRDDALKWTNPIDWDTPDERWRPESEYGRYIQSLPSAEAEPIRHGYWESVFDNNGHHKVCPYCGEWRYHTKQRYCGYCGAKMDEVRE